MMRFYYSRSESTYAIFDRHKSNTKPMCWTDDVNAAEVICEALNELFEEKPNAT
jgi:hypothetical protein